MKLLLLILNVNHLGIEKYSEKTLAKKKNIIFAIG